MQNKKPIPTKRKNPQQPHIKGVKGARLEILWRPPQMLAMMLIAGLLFAAVGYAALRFSDAATSLRVLPIGGIATYGDVQHPSAYRLALWQKASTDGVYTLDYVGSQQSGGSALPDKDNEGRVGWTMDQFIDQMPVWLSAYTPDVVLLQVGSADIEQGRLPEQIQVQLKQLLEAIEQASPKTVVLVSPAVPTYVSDDQTIVSFEQYAGLVRETVEGLQSEGVRYVNTIPSLSSQSKDTGVYLSDTLYSDMADAWYQAIRAEFPR